MTEQVEGATHPVQERLAGPGPTTRRSILGGAAFAVPVIAFSVSAPAMAATSAARKMTITAVPSQGSAAASVDTVSAAVAGFSFDITVKVTDSTDAPLSGQPVALSGPTGVAFGQANGTTDGSGVFATTATLSLSGTGSATITASSSGVGGTVSASTGLAYRPRLITASLSSTALAVGDSATLTVTVTTGNGVPLSGEPVSVSESVFVGPSSVSFSPSNGTTNASGVFTTTVTRTGSTTPTSIGVISNGAGGAISTSVTLRLVPGLTVAIGVSPDTITAGGLATVAVTVADSSFLPAANRSVTFSGTNVTFAQASGTTNSSGHYETTLTATGNGGSTETITASVASGAAFVTKSTSLRVQSRQIAIALSPTEVAPGASTSATVTVTDASGSPLASQAVALSSSSDVSFAQASGTTNSAGQFVTQATVAASATTSSSTITASSSGAGGTVTASATLALVPETVTLWLSPSSGSKRLRNVFGAYVTVTRNGAPVVGETVTISTTDTNTSFRGVSSGQTDAQGKITFTADVLVKLSGFFNMEGGPFPVTVTTSTGQTATATYTRT